MFKDTLSENIMLFLFINNYILKDALFQKDNKINSLRYDKINLIRTLIMKEIKIKIKDINKWTFEITEDAKSGDYFALNSINKNNLETIQESIRIAYEAGRELFIKNEILAQHDKIINEFKVSDEFTNINKSNTKLNAEIGEMKRTHILEQGVLKSRLEAENVKKINDLSSQLETLKATRKKDIEIANAKILSEYAAKEAKFEVKLENIKLATKSEFTDQINSLTMKNKIMEQRLMTDQNTYENKINELKTEHLNRLKERDQSNIKLIGEELEGWIVQEYNRCLGMDNDVSLDKTTKSIGGTKPDFIYKILNMDKSVLDSVTIEAKTESTTGKTRNSDHFETLDKNRKNLNSTYALLVSELEPKKDFIIKSVSGYNNMFIVRPVAMIPFLGLIKFITLKRRSIIDAEINFKQKQDIVNEFDKMKAEILENSFKNIDKNINDIIKHAEKIKLASDGILESAHKALDKHLITAKNKIKAFDVVIRKTNKNISKIED